MISQGVLDTVDPTAWRLVEGKTIQVKGYVPGQMVTCKVIILEMTVGKYTNEFFEHVFCVDPRKEYKVIFGNDLAKGLKAVHDHAEQKVTFKALPGRRNQLRLPLIPASKMKLSRTYRRHQQRHPISPIVAAIETGMEERAENLLGGEAMEYLG